MVKYPLQILKNGLLIVFKNNIMEKRFTTVHSFFSKHFLNTLTRSIDITI